MRSASRAASGRRPVGVFDSGIGGLSVLQALRAELPHEDFIYLADSGFAPYGERGDAFVTARTLRITEHLLHSHQIKALVIACNTATAAAVRQLREQHSALPLIGVEPAVKPAASLSHSGHVGVMGTRGTVTSAKFQTLLRSLDGQAQFHVQPCDGLAAAIEDSALRPQASDRQTLRALCQQHLGALGSFGSEAGQIDTLVLGCTHYVFIADLLREQLPPSVQIVDNGAAVARQARRLLTQSNQLNAAGDGSLQLLTTGEPRALHDAATHLLGLAPQTVAPAAALA